MAEMGRTSHLFQNRLLMLLWVAPSMSQPNSLLVFMNHIKVRRFGDIVTLVDLWVVGSIDIDIVTKTLTNIYRFTFVHIYL